jgi:hypothetical protein
LSEINYFVYKEPFDVKILILAAFNYVTSNISAIILSIITMRIDPATLDNISSELVYAGLNYICKYDQQGFLMTFLM